MFSSHINHMKSLQAFENQNSNVERQKTNKSIKTVRQATEKILQQIEEEKHGNEQSKANLFENKIGQQESLKLP